MEASSAVGLLRRSGVVPLVRPTRTQYEVEYLPPYGDPEVHIPGEVLTYLVLTGVAVEVFGRLRR